jgi:hydrogenase maturation protein HypF
LPGAFGLETLGFVTDRRRIRISAKGRVQGVGFRPFLWKRATEIGLTGWVQNDSSGVTVEVQGRVDRVGEFLAAIETGLPPLAVVDSLTTSDVPIVDETHFEIRPSAVLPDNSTPVSPDVTVCHDCRSEMGDKRDRRYRYPFINCTNCGPRFTIVEEIPYDRDATTMKSFEMCRACRTEYDDPSDRRFHAQPNACPKCGPKIWFASPDDGERAFAFPPEHCVTSERAIEEFRTAICGGQIVAVKGIGGFHLACDPTDRETVQRLRERKGRIEKPFAVMVADVAQAESFAHVGDAERGMLEGTQRPIVLLRKRVDGALVAMLDAVAPGNDFVGVMLPHSPLHHLLMEDAGPLLMTSGNVSEEPITRTNLESYRRLRSIADHFLLHDRDIHAACDDSVVRCVNTSVLPIRRSRGYAPMPVRLGDSGPSVLAVGGELKSTFCVTKADYAYVSQHIGDLGNLETLEALKRNVEHFQRMFRVDVEAVIADLHPNYLSSRWGQDLSRSIGVPLFGVQHHFAHAVSLHTEHAMATEQAIIACCFDGTGYGTDGAIWGGEFLIADGRTFRRLAHLNYFPLPGGDACARTPSRTALALLHSCGLPWEQWLPCVAACPVRVRSLLKQQLEKRVHCVSTSSIGRLFDAVASIIGVRHQVSYEAQAAMEMEAVASKAIGEGDQARWQYEITPGPTIEIGCKNLIEAICSEITQGGDRGTIAAQFHLATAKMVTDVCVIARESSQTNTVGLTGGVFQNVLLLRLVEQGLRREGFEVLTHSIMPPNDGGLALGQAAVGRNRLLSSATTA